jgi:methyltransferase
MVSWGFYGAVLLAVIVERLVELRISNRNAQAAFDQGGREYGQGHFGVMKALHTLFLVACAAEVVLLDRPFHLWLAIPATLGVVATMALRYWAISTLGQRWNTRVIVVPGLGAVNEGPYRWLRHPNYVAVVLELAFLPLIHGAWLTALVFGVANLVLLRTRIQVEERALAEHCDYDQRLGDRRRFVPSGPESE